MPDYYGSTADDGTAWYTWASSTGTNTTTAASFIPEVWRSWTSEGTANFRDADASPPPRFVTAAEVAREERERQRGLQQRHRRLRQEERERAVAQKRARKLLLSLLSRDQAKDYEEHHWFQLRVRSGRVYRIAQGYQGNIIEIGEQGTGIARYCIHPTGDVPDEDTMLAQKLMLENDEERFLAIANASQY